MYSYVFAMHAWTCAHALGGLGLGLNTQSSSTGLQGHQWSNAPEGTFNLLPFVCYLHVAHFHHITVQILTLTQYSHLDDFYTSHKNSS